MSVVKLRMVNLFTEKKFVVVERWCDLPSGHPTVFFTQFQGGCPVDVIEEYLTKLSRLGCTVIIMGKIAEFYEFDDLIMCMFREGKDYGYQIVSDLYQLNLSYTRRYKGTLPVDHPYLLEINKNINDVCPAWDPTSAGIVCGIADRELYDRSIITPNVMSSTIKDECVMEMEELRDRIESTMVFATSIHRRLLPSKNG